MMTFKNNELEAVLLTLAAYDSDTGAPVSGLLFEDIPMSLRRRLQKIQKKVTEHHKNMVSSADEIRSKFKDNPDAIESEMTILGNEIVTVDEEPADISFIEEIKTNKNYQFEIIEKFAK